MFDTQMRQRPADLGQCRAIDRTASRRRMKVMRAPIGVEAQR